MELESIPRTDIAALESFLSEVALPALHPRHAVVMSAKQALSVAYGRVGMATMTRAERERKVQLCREVIDTMRKLEPGMAARIGRWTSEALIAEY